MQTLKTISAKIPAGAKAAFEERAKLAEMSKSEYLRMVIEKSVISSIQKDEPPNLPVKSGYREPSPCSFCKENEKTTVLLRQISNNQNAIIKNNKLVSNLLFSTIGLVLLGNFIILMRLNRTQNS